MSTVREDLQPHPGGIEPRQWFGTPAVPADTFTIDCSDLHLAEMLPGGESNMPGSYGIDQYVRDRDVGLGRPWEATDTWLRQTCPFLNADEISTTTLFLCGGADFNVPLAVSEQIDQALKCVGVPTRLVIYPGQHHSFTRQGFPYDKRQRYVDRNDRYLREQP